MATPQKVEIKTVIKRTEHEDDQFLKYLQNQNT